MAKRSREETREKNIALLAKKLKTTTDKIRWALGEDPYLAQAQAANNIEEAERVYGIARWDWAARALALQKWEKLSLAQIQAATNLTEAYKAYKLSPSGLDSWVEKVAIEKYESLYVAKVMAAKTYAEAKAAREADKPFGCDPITWQLAEERLAMFCSTAAQLRDLHGRLKTGSEIEKMVLEKWESLALVQVQTAATLDEIREASKNSPCMGKAEARKLAMQKWESIVMDQAIAATTVAEAEMASENAPDGPSKARDLARQKWRMFCSTLAEAEALRKITRPNTVNEQLIILKIIELMRKK